MSIKRIEEYTEEELFEELKRRRAARGKTTAKTLWEIEEQVEQTQAEDYRALVEAYVLEPEGGEAKPCPRCGSLARVRAKGRVRRVRTAGGEIRYARNYHYCETCQEGFYPKDGELGLPALGELSPKMEAKVLDFGVNTPYEEAASRWKVHYAVPISETLVRAVVERVGIPWEHATAKERQEGTTRTIGASSDTHVFVSRHPDRRVHALHPG